ncbi:hypothetical protein S40288_11253 [Stachybotrys chartarum IBT 40288]|nr:hypothetical protein S40288_11253 [Stachybotrys chartarum IBT 40288]
MEHILNAAKSEKMGSEPDTEASNDGVLISQDEIDKMRGFLQKAIAKSVAREKAEGNEEKALGAGSAGRKGVTEIGAVMKRDTGDTPLGGGLDHTYGRWRPGFRYEILLGLFSTVIDYGTNRKLWRALDKPSIIAGEWIWTDTPNDVHSLFSDGVVKDLREIFRREVLRVQNRQILNYEADKTLDRDAQYPLLLDRGGEYIARHLVGQPLPTDRGYLLAWILCISNDIQDYESDVVAGETNSLCRGISSKQQIFDAARYNRCLGLLPHDVALQHRQTVRPLRAQKRPNPGLHQPSRNGAAREPDGQALPHALLTSYWGCSCDVKPRGHDTSEMLVQALKQGDNDPLEEKMHLEFSHLSIGASKGNIHCECGLDLLAYDSFVKFFHLTTAWSLVYTTRLARLMATD